MDLGRYRLSKLGFKIYIYFPYENNFKYVTNMNWWVVFLAIRWAPKLTKDLSNPAGVGRALEVPHKPPTAQFWHFHLSIVSENRKSANSSWSTFRIRYQVVRPFIYESSCISKKDNFQLIFTKLLFNIISKIQKPTRRLGQTNPVRFVRRKST